MHVKEFLIKKVSRRHCGKKSFDNDFFSSVLLSLGEKSRQVMARVTAVRAGMTRKVFISSSSPSSALSFASTNNSVPMLSNFLHFFLLLPPSDTNNQSEKCLWRACAWQRMNNFICFIKSTSTPTLSRIKDESDTFLCILKRRRKKILKRLQKEKIS